MQIFRAGEKGFERYLSRKDERGEQGNLRLERKVRSILEQVRKKGDEALLYYTQSLDGLRIPVHRLRVKPSEVESAYQKLPADFLRTLKKATRRIQIFHHLLSKRLVPSVKREDRGIQVEQRMTPLQRVGVYVPGGKASYPSTVLMAAIPAKAAGVREILMVTPPQKEGISPAVLVAADLAGIDRIYRVGGVQAVAALAYGTKSIPKVDKIVGPGNRYVATAKRLVYGEVDIDMVAGPSEILIVSDGSAPASYLAADLLSQAEHDQMALAILITDSEAFGWQVKKEVDRQLPALRRRKIASQSLERTGAILIVKNLEQAVELANRIAPEHLELAVSRPLAIMGKVKNAGAVFLGSYSPEAVGDYMAGSNHILPTAGTARFSSPLGVEDFVKRTSVVKVTRRALEGFEKDIQRFADWEGLEGHARSVRMRIGRR